MANGDNTLSFAAQSTENGESEETLDLAYAKDPVKIGFNSGYLLDFLKSVGKGEVKVSLKDGQTAALLEPVGEGLETRYQVVIMPMRS